MPFLRNTPGTVVQTKMVLTGTQGYRLLASPFKDVSYRNLFNGLWLQGMANSNATSGLSNLYSWNTNLQRWDAITDANGIASETPLLAFIFEDDDFSSTGVQTGFPKTVSVRGSEIGSKSIQISDNADEWTLLGNPFASGISWNALQRGAGVGNAVYVFDNSISNWRSFNGSVGSLSNGNIGAFQSFFVYSLASGDKSIQFANARVAQNGFVGKQAEPFMVEVEVSNESLKNTMYLHFHEDGELGLSVF
jgi:hypothetical protein